jgi:hypothetical protein
MVGWRASASNGACLHRVIVLLVSLDVLPKGNSTVLGIVYVNTRDNRARAERLRDAEPVGKCI